jgi:hypothetical protein
MIYGTEPVFPFDLSEATFLGNLNIWVSTENILAVRSRQLQKREEDLERIKEMVWQYRRKLAGIFSEKHAHTIKDYNFGPGKLVMVRNSGAESGLKNKYHPRYLGPFVVVKRSKMGTYMLAEMDGTLSKLRFAAWRVIPYHLRTSRTLPIPNATLQLANTLE